MRHYSSFNKLALENENAPAEVAADAGAGVDSLETSLIDVNADTAQSDVNDAALATAEGAADALEDIAEGMEETLEAGGLTPEAANVVGIAVEHFYKQLNIENKPIVSLEAFGNTSSKVQATRVALEGIKETAKAIWAKIKEWLAKFADFVMAQYNKIFGNAEKLAKRAEALRTRAEGTTGTAKNATFTNETVAKALHINGNTDKIASGMAAVAIATKNTFGKSFDATEKSVTEHVAELENVGEKGIDSFELGASVLDSDEKVIDPTKLGYNKSSAEGVDFVVGPEFPGGKICYSYVNTKALKGEAAVAAARVNSQKVGAANNAKAPTVKETVKTLSTADCVKVTESVVSIADELKAFRNKSAKLKEVFAKANKAAATLSGKADGETDATKAKAYQSAGKALTGLIRIAAEMQTSFSAYALNTSKSALDAVELSLKEYGAAK